MEQNIQVSAEVVIQVLNKMAESDQTLAYALQAATMQAALFERINTENQQTEPGLTAVPSDVPSEGAGS